MFPALLLRNPIASGLAAACVALVVVVGVQTGRLSLAQSRLETMTAKYEGEAKRAATAVLQLETATAGLREAEAINRRQAEALARQGTAIAALRAEADRQADAAAERERQVLEQLAAVRQRDRERRARSDIPAPDEMTNVLRETIGAL